MRSEGGGGKKKSYERIGGGRGVREEEWRKKSEGEGRRRIEKDEE